MFNKTVSNMIHCLRRLEERYGIENSEQFYLNMIEYIQTDFNHEIYKQSKTRSVHIIKTLVNGSPINLPVVYCKRTKTIITVLPQHWNYKSFETKMKYRFNS